MPHNISSVAVPLCTVPGSTLGYSTFLCSPYLIGVNTKKEGSGVTSSTYIIKRCASCSTDSPRAIYDEAMYLFKFNFFWRSPVANDFEQAIGIYDIDPRNEILETHTRESKRRK